MQRRYWTSGWGVAMWLALVLLMGVRAYGQTGGLIDAKVVSLGLGGVAGGGGLYRPGAWVPVRVRLENRSGRTLTGRLGVQQPDLDGDKALSVGGKFVLSPSADARDVWLYYWPRPDDILAPVQQVLIMDEAGEQVVQTVPVKGAERVDRGSDHSSRWVVVLGPSLAAWSYFTQSYGGTEGVRYSQAASAGDMPDNVLGLDGVDVVVWEADAVKPSDLAADFQMKALLEWVRSGGHLIITAGRQGEELEKSGALHEALPMNFTGVRQVAAKDFAVVTGMRVNAKTEGTVSQLIGDIKEGNGAKVVSGGRAGVFADHPLVVTGLYGRGAVTVLTVDAAAREISDNLVNEGAMEFWDWVAGWQAGVVMTKATHDADSDNAEKKGNHWNDSPQTVALGAAIPGQVDVTEVTQVRLLVAVLFLLVYWLAAGPIGHVILKAYGLVHWSWWAFGGTVIVAAGLAAGVVAVLHLTNYDLRHKTVVIGTVNGREVTALGYYGVFAPASGTLVVEEPAPPAGTSGLDYLAPLCEPTDEGVRPFADPQSYTLWDEKAWSPAPVFRNTLKKMQGKWTGQMGGVEGTAQRGALVTQQPLIGELTNRSGYDLERVEFVVWDGSSSNGFVFGLDTEGKGATGGVWKAGGKISLATMVVPENRASRGRILSEVLTDIAKQHASGGGLMRASRFGTGGGAATGDAPRDEDLLDVLLDARRPEVFASTDPRYEPLRGLARGMDVTKLLHAAGCVIVAEAGDMDGSPKRYVKSPVPISVNGRVVAGEGDVLFVWVLPLPEAGEPPLVPGGVGGRGPE